MKSRLCRKTAFASENRIRKRDAGFLRCSNCRTEARKRISLCLCAFCSASITNGGRRRIKRLRPLHLSDSQNGKSRRPAIGHIISHHRTSHSDAPDKKTEQTDYTQAFARVCNRKTPFKMLPEATENRQEQPRADKVRRFPPAEDFTRLCQSAIMRIVIPLHL